MQQDILYRKMRDGEEDRVFDLIRAAFDELVLPDMTREGSKEFFRAAREMIYDRPAGHFTLVAESTNVIVGMIDVRTNSHICLFFVARAFQRRGIGRGLLEQAQAECIASDPKASELDVNSSPFAVEAYKRLGFLQSEPEQSVNGIRFVPMIKAFNNIMPESNH